MGAEFGICKCICTPEASTNDRVITRNMVEKQPLDSASDNSDISSSEDTDESDCSEDESSSDSIQLTESDDTVDSNSTSFAADNIHKKCRRNASPRASNKSSSSRNKQNSNKTLKHRHIIPQTNSISNVSEIPPSIAIKITPSSIDNYSSNDMNSRRELYTNSIYSSQELAIPPEAYQSTQPPKIGSMADFDPAAIQLLATHTPSSLFSPTYGQSSQPQNVYPRKTSTISSDV